MNLVLLANSLAYVRLSSAQNFCALQTRLVYLPFFLPIGITALEGKLVFHKVTMSESKKAKTTHPSNTEDDLENKWGRFLVPEDAVKEPKYADSDKFLHELQHKVNTACNPFRLVHVSTSGSDANGWAICKLTDVNRKKCLFACGSYVAGEDNGPFFPFSTSKITDDKFCFINTDPHSLACEQTVPFPYHIPCEGCDSLLLDLEMECLNEIHTRCLLAKALNNSITCVFF